MNTVSGAIARAFIRLMPRFRRYPVERSLAQAFAERLAFEILHDQVGLTSTFPDIVHGADIRVIQCGCRTGFSLKSLTVLRIAGIRTEKHLRRNGAIQAGIACTVDFSHSASA